MVAPYVAGRCMIDCFEVRLCENPDLMPAIEVSGIHLGDCIPDMKAEGGPGSIA